MPTRVGARREHVTIREAARLIGVHENTVRKWEERGIIRAVHLPGSGFRRVPAAEIKRIRDEMWRDLPVEEDAGVVPASVPHGVLADDGFGELT
jgi:excisionase family DNA binding protein